MRRLGIVACVLVCVLLLVIPMGCGGGGGTSRVAITLTNAEEVGSTVLGAIDFLFEWMQISVMFAEVISEGDGLIDVPCPGGGNITGSVNDAPPLGEISAGDSAVLNFNGCIFDIDGELATMNGQLRFTVTSFSDVSPSGFSASISYQASNLSMMVSTDSTTLSGNYVIDIFTTDDIEMDWRIRGTSLRATIMEPLGTMEATIRNFIHDLTSNDATGDFGATFEGEVYTSDLGGYVAYNTLLEFTGTDPNDPDSGDMEVLGASLSRMLFETLDAINVRLTVDEDGDGTPEGSIDTTWAALGD